MEVNKIIYPSSPLSRYVKYYWILKADRINSVHVLPVGLPQLAFHRGDKIRYSSNNIIPQAYLRGQLTQAHNLVFDGKVDMIAIIFNPTGFQPFFKLPLINFQNQYIDISEIEDKELNYLSDAVSQGMDDENRIHLIERFLLSRLSSQSTGNFERIDFAIRKIGNNVDIDIASLAQGVCLGYRHFKRVFTDYAGINPKDFLKVIRFQKSLLILHETPQIEKTKLAYECGFYDHSHMIKDYKSLSGYNPTGFLLTQQPYSTFYSPDCRLNHIAE